MSQHIMSERADLFEPNIYISMVVKYKGDIDPIDIMEAVRKTYTSNESTMSRIVLTSYGDAYYEKMEHTGCRVQIDCRDYLTILLENERDPFAIWDGELIRTFIIPGKEESTIFIMAHHLVGDGTSILLFIREIAECIIGNELTYRSLELLDVTSLPQKFHMPGYLNTFIKKVNERWKREGRIFNWEDYRKIHKHYWENHQSILETEQYPINSISEQCPEGITLNTFIVTMLAKRNLQSKKIGIPVSIRGESKSMANLTTGFQISFIYNSKRSFESNLSKVHRGINKIRKSSYRVYRVLSIIAQMYPSAVDGILMNVHGLYHKAFAKHIATAMQYNGRKLQDLGISNLMSISEMPKNNQFSILDILFIPPKVSYSKEVYGINTYGNTLHICHHKMVKIS